MKSKLTKRFRVSVLKISIMCALFVLSAAVAPKTAAQGVTNITVTGIPGIINDPYTDAFFDNFLNGRYQVIFTYNNTNTMPVDFSFRFTLFQDNKQVLEVESTPESYVPGAYVFTTVFADLPFPDTLDDILRQISSKLQNQIIQGGTVPEGRYRLEIKAVPVPETPGISSMPSITNFVVVYPEAPILINPADKSVVAQAVPVFNWTAVPIGGQLVNYEFLLVEVFEGQTPLQAIQSNRAHAEQTLTGSNTLIYTPEFLPLENGREYAWRVKAVSPTGELAVKNNGESPVRIFTYEEGAVFAGGEIEEITLIPGFAKLTNLGNLDKTSRGGLQVLNGEATLELFNQAQQSVAVWLNNFEVQAANPRNPVVTGGSFEAVESLAGLDIISEVSAIADIKDLRWRYATQAIEVIGDIVLPDDERIPSDSWINLTPGGLTGKLTADNPGGVLIAGSDPLELYLEKFEASFPERQVFATGRVEFFDGTSVCELTQLNVLESESQAIINCPDDARVELVEGSAQLELVLENLNGVINYNFTNSDFSYNLAANGEIIFGLEDLTACNAFVQANLNNEAGFSVSQITPACSIYAPSIDLGFMKLKLHEVAMNRFDYTGSGNWDFDFSLDASLQMPAMDNWKLPRVAVDLTAAGLKFPELSWDEFELGILNPLNISGFGIRPVEFSMGEFTFPWFNWNSDDIESEKTGDWEFGFDFDFTMPDFARLGGEHNSFILPPCFVAQNISGLSGSFSKGNFNANIPATLLRDCSFDLAEGYTFTINELGGELTATASAVDFNLESELSIDAGLTAGYPFTCSAGGETGQVISADLKLDNRGLLTGNIAGAVDACNAAIGPLKIGNLSSDLVFESTGNTQGVAIEASGELTAGSSLRVEGDLRYNIINGTFDALSFDYDNPFLLTIPSEEHPVLTFLTRGFSVSEAGLFIDGRQEFLLGDQNQIITAFEGQAGVTGGPGGTVTVIDMDDLNFPEEVQRIGVTFDEVLFSLTELEIVSGQIIFDETFALSAAVNERNKDIDFSVTKKEAGENVPGIQPNSLYAELGAQVIIDRNGLHTGGTARAALKVGSFEFEDLSVDFSEDFYLRLNPFKVNTGEADIYLESRRIAYFNDSGFFLDPSYLVLAIPDTLYLPTEETAYIVLRNENGDLLVDVQRNANGNYVMNTLSPVDLAVPALQGELAAAPKVAVTFDDVVYNPGSREIEEGAFQGDFSPALDLSYLEIPFQVHRIRYDNGWSVNDETFGAERGLFLEGEILLFEESLGEKGRIALYLENGERLRGDLELADLDAEIPLTDGSAYAVLGVDTLGLSIDVSLISLETPLINFDLDGQMRFKNEQNEPMAAMDYKATYSNSRGFMFSSAKQPEDELSTRPYFAGPVGFSIDKINSLDLHYASAVNRFSFNSEVDFSVWMSFDAGDTLKVPLSGVDIKETGITVPRQYANESSTPALRAAPVAFGPAELTLLSFETLSTASFNWFTGEAMGTGFKMDFDLRLAAFEDNSPAASSATITIKNVGYNQGVLTGEIEDYTFRSPGAPIAFGSSTNFYLTKVGGGLVNDGTETDPVQGFDIRLTGNLQNDDLFAVMDDSCINPELELQLSGEGGLIGSVTDITPCGVLAYGPAKISFNQDSRLDFSFNNQEQSIILDGGVEAVIEQPERPEDITATGDIKVDIIAGNLIDGEILVNNPFDYGYPANDPLFNFRIQQARLNQAGLVISGDADLGFPGTTKTVGVEFVNFTIHPKQNHAVSGEFTIEEAFAFEVGVSPVTWAVVDPESVFDADNAARITLAAGLTVNKDGLQLTGDGTAEIRALEEFYGELQVDYTGFELGFSPVAVQEGRADFTLSGSPSPFGYLDKDGFNLDIPGLIASVIPDTLPLPTMETAYLVLGDDDGSRWAMEDTGTGRTIQTLPDKTVELVIPKATNAGGEMLKAQVEFSALVDQYMAITAGSVTLKEELNLDEFLGIPLILDTLNYTSGTQKLMAGARVLLPSSLNDVVLATTLEIGSGGFEQATLSAGEFAEFYTTQQDEVEPLAHADLGDGAFEIFVRGFEAEIGNTNSLKFSGQIKSSILKNTEDEVTPIHYAAKYGSTGWQINIDDGNLNRDGINLGYAQIRPYESAGAMFTVTMDADEFAVAFSGTVSMPELLGHEFSVDVDEFKISSLPNYVTINASANLPDQEFTLIDETLTFTSTETSVAFADNILTLTTSGNFDFYNKTDLEFTGLSFNSAGEISLAGADVNLLPDPIALLPEDILVLEELRLGIENSVLFMAAVGSSKLPDPLDASAQITIRGDIEGNFDITGPEFIFDDKMIRGNNPDTEFALGDFATFELLGLGVNIDLKKPARTALYAGGVIYVNNENDKLIKFGDVANLNSKPGIKYSLDNGVEWNIESSFSPGDLAFDYDFFSFDVLSVSIEKDVSIGGEIVPFQVEFGASAGLNIAGVQGSVDFTGFKFSTRGVDSFGNFAGGSFSLMNVVSLELGRFDYQRAEGDQKLTLQFVEGSGSVDDVATDTVTVDNVTKYLHFRSVSGGQALRLSLGEAFSGGVEEVLAYTTGDGDNFLRIKNASLSFTDQVSLFASMEYITEGSNFALRVAGGGTFSEVGIAAAGSISTLDNELSFGIFVAVKAPVTFLGIIEMNKIGGGFYYRPVSRDLDMVVDAIKAMDSGFQLNGPQPDVDNLKFAVLFYAGISIGGTGDYSAISANALIQITDQFTKIDANGYALGQKNRFKAGMYLTALYTPNISGIEGGISLDILYDPVLEGQSRVDFFATKETGRSMLWGVTGHFKLEVLPALNMLSVEGDLIVSNDGLFLDLAASSGFDIAIISANSSFNLIVWYLPDYSDPLGIYGEFSISFSVLAGAAKFRATVEGGYFDRGSYSVLYFGGSAYVSVLWVFSGTMKGWVKFQTKSPRFDYGRGSNAEMDELIGAAKEYANKAKEKAEETKAALDDAKDRLNNALAAGDIKGFSEDDLREAGFKLVTGEINFYNQIKSILAAERSLGEAPLPAGFEWLAEVMNGKAAPYYEAPDYLGWTPDNKKARPLIEDDKSTVTEALDELASALPAVEERLDEAIAALTALSVELNQSLEDNEVFSIQRPVSGVSNGATDQNGNLVASPSFNVDTTAVESNKDKLTDFEGSIYEADLNYINALKLAASSISLVDLVVDGKTYIDWETVMNEDSQSTETSTVSTSGGGGTTTMAADLGLGAGRFSSASLGYAPITALINESIFAGINADFFKGNTLDYSVNEASRLYATALMEVRKYNSKYIGSYWELADWARSNYEIVNRGIVIDYAARLRNNLQGYLIDLNNNNIGTEWALSDGYNFDAAVALAKRREDIIVDMGAETPQNPVDKILRNEVSGVNYTNQQRYEKLFNNVVQLWEDLPKYGFLELEERAKHVADSLAPHITNTIRAIGTDYRAFTEKVEELYGIKSEMLVTMHGMIENYNLWQTEVFGFVQNVESDGYYTNNLKDIENLLSPPSIVSLSGQPGKGKNTTGAAVTRNKDFYGIAELSYVANHPNDITEVSFALEGDDPMSLSGLLGEPVTNIYSIRDYYTAGPGLVGSLSNVSLGFGRFDLYIPRLSDSQISTEITGAVRVRGGGGNTASKLVNITVPLGKSDNNVSFATVSAGTDATPPTKPVVTHEYTSSPLINGMPTAYTPVETPYRAIQPSTALWASNEFSIPMFLPALNNYYNYQNPIKGATRGVAFTTPTVALGSAAQQAPSVQNVQVVQPAVSMAQVTVAQPAVTSVPAGRAVQTTTPVVRTEAATAVQPTMATVQTTPVLQTIPVTQTPVAAAIPRTVVSNNSGLGTVITSPVTVSSMRDMQAAVTPAVTAVQPAVFTVPPTVITAVTTKYWVPDSTKISFTIASADKESGVSKFEYRIGTTRGAGNIRDWTTAQGSRITENSGIVIGAGTGGAWFSVDYTEGSDIMQTTIRGVSFQPGQDYYFSFRTENGDKVKSEVTNISTPFRFDGTPPTMPKITLSPADDEIEIQTAPENPVVQNKTRTTPGWVSSRVNYDDYYTPHTNQVSSWSSDDSESGIAGYYVATSYDNNKTDEEIFADVGAAFRPVTEETEEQFFSQYKYDQYLYVKAVNKAGLESGTSMITLRSVDRTPPTTPLVAVKEEIGGFTIYIRQLAEDRQTGVVGYQYAILSENGADTLRSWPRGQQVDIANPTPVGGSFGPQPPSLFVDALNGLQVAKSGAYKVAVRAINTRGMPSRVVLTENVIIDNTPPTKPAARVKFGEGNALKVDFTQLSKDPESGIASVKYEIVYGSGFGSHLGTLMRSRVRSGETSEIIAPCGGINIMSVSARNTALQGTIANPSLEQPSYISLNEILNEYAEIHPCLSEFTESEKQSAVQQMVREGYIPELVIKVRNGVGLETTSRFSIEIPANMESNYEALLRDK